LGKASLYTTLLKSTLNILLSTFSSDGKHKASQWIFQIKTKIEMKEVDISLKKVTAGEKSWYSKGYFDILI
jgi:hypothetical protein